MPIDEFLRLPGRKIHRSDDQTSIYNEFTSRVQNDLAELVWENGQITVQEQSAQRVSKPPFIDSLTQRLCSDGLNPLLMHNKVGKIDSVFDDITPEVPSGGELDEIAPWFYPFENEFGNGPQILPEVSTITQHCDDYGKAAGQSQNRRTSSSCGGVSGISNPMIGIPFENQGHHHHGIDPFSDSGNGQRKGGASNSPKVMNFTHFSKLCGPTNDPKAQGPVSSPASAKGKATLMERFNIDSNMAMNLRDMIDSIPSPVNPKGKGSSSSSAECCRPFEGYRHFDEKISESIPETLQSPKNNIPNGGDQNNIACSSVGSGQSVDIGSCSKRKLIDHEESGSRSDEMECSDTKGARPVGEKGIGTKRTRAAEVHNLSERRRRDRINEKMKALQELIPNCNKADKASMLDEAIEYLKMLQLQVQIMSMGAGICMPPMMFPPGMQPMFPPPHLPHFPVGMGMGFGVPDMRARFFPPGVPVYGQPAAGTPFVVPLCSTVPSSHANVASPADQCHQVARNEEAPRGADRETG